MTLRLVQGNLLIVSGQLANSEDCCCPPPIPDCASSRTLDYWLLEDNPSRPLGKCCEDLAGTYFPDPAFTTANSYRRRVDFVPPDPCVDNCNSYVIPSVNEFGQIVLTTHYWSLASIDIKTELDDGTGYLGTSGGLTIIAKTRIDVEFFYYTQVGSYACEYEGIVAVFSEEVATNCPFFVVQFLRSQGPGDNGPCNLSGVSNAGMKLTTVLSFV